MFHDWSPWKLCGWAGIILRLLALQSDALPIPLWSPARYKRHDDKGLDLPKPIARVHTLVRVFIESVFDRIYSIKAATQDKYHRYKPLLVDTGRLHNFASTSMQHHDINVDVTLSQCPLSKRAHDDYTTSHQRRCNVMTLHRHWCDVVSTFRARWANIAKAVKGTCHTW